MARPIPLLMIGAGPFGLAMAAYARHEDIEHILLGKPMDFWRSNMPKGMVLRSGCDWHYDPFNEDTIERFLETRHLTPSDVEPLALDLYLSYCEWFIQQKAIESHPGWVQQLNSLNSSTPIYEAVLEDGRTITARNVVLALGMRYFKNVPEPYPALFPPGRFMHTCDLVDFSPLKGKRVLIIGGRQSAFEWAGLIRDAGAETIYQTYRHPTPAFVKSDWSWVNPTVDAIVANPGWYRNLPVEEKEQVNQRFWAEGRLKLEPWLAARISKEGITLFPQTQVTDCREMASGELEVCLNDETALAVDQIVLATGYKVDVNRVPLLANGNILPQFETQNGYPVLDEHLQSNLPGLFFTSNCAVQDFGPYFAFTVSVRASAKLIGSGLKL